MTSLAEKSLISGHRNFVRSEPHGSRSADKLRTSGVISTMKLFTNYIVFDLDGTLVNSTDAVEAIWKETVDQHNLEYPDQQIDLAQFLTTSHGSRTVETFEKCFPYKDRSVEAIRLFELSIATKYGHLAKEVPGSTDALNNLNAQAPKSWAICTSGTYKLAHGWFPIVYKDVAKPLVFITADDVSQGKPNPEGYLKAATTLAELNDKKGKTVVFEDAPTGIRAGVNAGFTVIGIATTFSKAILEEAGASFVVEDFTKVHMDFTNDGINLVLKTL